MNVKNGIIPASAVCPASWAIIIGPPKSFTDASPDPIILRLSIIITKLPNVRDQPIDTASNGVTPE